jgi:5'-3' exonuclease
MIIVDFNQTAISNLMAEIGSRKDIEVQPDLLRHMILNSIRGYKQKFGKEYGELVIACDNREYWRKQKFPLYKAGRKKARDESGLDWKSIFETLNSIREDLATYFPYKVLDIAGAEADDVIAVMAKWSQTNDTSNLLFDEAKPFLIISGDHDFIQLHKYSNVKQFSPVQKKFVKAEMTPAMYIFDHTLRGDKGDGIPNVLSADDSIVTNTRQKPIASKKVEEWFKNTESMPTDAEFLKNYERNKALIDFEYIPKEISEAIINTYEALPNKDKSKLLNYFIEHKMKNMLEIIEEF